MLLYALTIFVSAFLLFQIQPIAAKMILPWFGGGASVWSACMMFFQTALLLGYLYAHWLHEKLTPKRQAMVHSGLLFLSLASLPVSVDPSWRDIGMRQPALSVVGLLAVTVGLPYLLLSTTGPLLQSWYARAYRQGIPYRLYALSNLASMLALLSYPVLVEPNWTVRFQGRAWSVGYGLFAILCAVTAWRSSGTGAAVDQAEQDGGAEPLERPAWTQCVLWVTLAACASILLLSITRHLTQDVAPVPFLWILPLSLYLLSFILTFEAPRYYHRPTFLVALPIALCGVAYILDYGGFDMVPLIAALSVALFVICMVCHGEMVRRKPHSRHLTMFYLMLSIGGALGGTFVGLVAPSIFSAYLEFPIGLALCGLLWAITAWNGLNKPLRAGAALAVCAYTIWTWNIGAYYVEGYRRVARNFYSQLRVEEYEEDKVGLVRSLLHGRIRHGEQAMSASLRRQPTAYYCADSGVGRALRSLDPARGHRIGVVGLGAGTLATYGRAGDTIRMYEINPQVVDLARSEFTFLSDTPAKVETVLGDARLMLEKESGQDFDILALDAFSGDSIPTHLLTIEGIGSYLRHIRHGGVLAMHITNRYLDLRPVVASAAEHYGRTAVIYEYKPPDDDLLCRSTTWALLLESQTAAHLAGSLSGGKALAPTAGFREWTDDYSNLLGILK